MVLSGVAGFFDPASGLRSCATPATPHASASSKPVALAPAPAAGASDNEHKLNTIRDLFDALRGCWTPPPPDEARPGMQMSVRFAFKRDGEIIGAPRVTYASPGAPADAREHYHDAISAALDRCTPLQFSAGLGGAIAGRPIALRVVDNRTVQ